MTSPILCDYHCDFDWCFIATQNIWECTRHRRCCNVYWRRRNMSTWGTWWNDITSIPLATASSLPWSCGGFEQWRRTSGPWFGASTNHRHTNISSVAAPCRVMSPRGVQESFAWSPDFQRRAALSDWRFWTTITAFWASESWEESTAWKTISPSRQFMKSATWTRRTRHWWLSRTWWTCRRGIAPVIRACSWTPLLHAIFSRWLASVSVCPQVAKRSLRYRRKDRSVARLAVQLWRSDGVFNYIRFDGRICQLCITNSVWNFSKVTSSIFLKSKILIRRKRFNFGIWIRFICNYDLCNSAHYEASMVEAA